MRKFAPEICDAPSAPSQPKKARAAFLQMAVDAVLAGDADSLQAIIEDPSKKCADPKEWLEVVGEGDDQTGWSVLHLAVAKEQIPCIELLVEKVPALVTRLAQPRSVTPLQMAIEKELDLDVIRALIKGNGKKAINKEERFSSPPLWLAYFVKKRGDYVINLIELLLANGAQYKDHCLRGPIRGGNVDVVKYVLDKGMMSASKPYERTFPLYEAASMGDPEILKLVLQRAPQMVKAKCREEEGETVLHAAVRKGNGECVAALIAAGANPCAQDTEGQCILMTAAAAGKADVVKVLLQNKAVRASAAKMMNWRDELHPLTNAVCSGSAETVRLLANSKFYRNDLGVRDESEYSGIMCELQDEFCIDWDRYVSLLSVAIADDKPEAEQIVDALLDAGFDPNFDRNPRPLSVAVVQESKAIIRLLMDAGANINYVCSSGRSKGKGESASDALVLAIQKKNEEILGLLLQYWPEVPAKLLLTYDNRSSITPIDVERWFKFLVSFGLVHGTLLIKKLKDKVTQKVTGPNLPLFLSYLQTPSSLKQLARFAVRKWCGEKCRKKEDELLHSMLQGLEVEPAELTSYLLMEVP